MAPETHIYTSWKDTPVEMQLTIATDIRPAYPPEIFIPIVRSTITKQSLKEPKVAELINAMLDWLEDVIVHLSQSVDTSMKEQHVFPPETYTYIHSFESLVDELEHIQAIDQTRHDDLMTLIDQMSNHNFSSAKL